ncbi:MAG: T9SS type A sorting domain-containing protein [Haliscomenobacter sp.]
MKQTLLALFFFLVLAQIGVSQSAGYHSQGWLADADIGREKTPRIEVFPNPASSYISLTESQSVQRIAVYNLVGRMVRVYDQVEEEKRYYIGDLPRGMYLVQILGDRNRIITTTRVHKE